jgi:hypothetical protein
LTTYNIQTRRKKTTDRRIIIVTIFNRKKRGKKDLVAKQHIGICPDREGKNGEQSN